MSIKSLRQARGLSQVKLSYAAEITPSRIQDYESGRMKPEEMRVKTALRLMEALGTDDIRDLLD
ncbi:helix-turn-helix domain-containing protein [Bifidobacterium panos]|uniref:HTH cro/C1-type domain-containing protein n=1 Tax=Bifidobacterium panos TaxID=2675321 RepID=A0ABX1SZQ4_9BIFI|nr:hypothetical protein [Bifidobacterium sp. DSM 109963]